MRGAPPGSQTLEQPSHDSRSHDVRQPPTPTACDSLSDDAEAGYHEGMNFPLLGTFVLSTCFLIQCGSSESNVTSTGDHCTSGTSCASGICAVSSDFPSGYCTQGCRLADSSSCPAGSACIDDVSGVPADAGIKAICYQTCMTDADCGRLGYRCLEKANHLVCRNGN